MKKEKIKINKIIFTGGGTAGHLMPLIAVGRELTKMSAGDGLKLYYVGSKEDCAVMAKENFKTYAVSTGKLRRYFSFKNATDIIFKIPFGFLQSLAIIFFVFPKLVFSKGGSGAVTVCLAAKILNIPVFVHESDAVAGLSNTKSSKWAQKIFVSFEKTGNLDYSKTTLSGNPIRKILLENGKNADPKKFGLTAEKPVILFMGGSQGSEAINDFALLILNRLLKKYEVIHIAGIKNYKKVLLESKAFLSDEGLRQYYHLLGYLNEAKLFEALKLSDLVVSRAGSGSIFEIAAFGKPSILIPLPSAAADHQSENAYRYAKTGSAMVMEQNNLTADFFIGEVDNLFSEPEKIKKMQEAALKFSKPKAAEMIAKEIIDFLKLSK